jgi:hypothetical protein
MLALLIRLNTWWLLVEVEVEEVFLVQTQGMVAVVVLAVFCLRQVWLLRQVLL